MFVCLFVVVFFWGEPLERFLEEEKNGKGFGKEKKNRTSMPLNLSRVFPVLAVADSGSCVGPQNEIGHPTHRYRHMMQIEYE